MSLLNFLHRKPKADPRDLDDAGLARAIEKSKRRERFGEGCFELLLAAGILLTIVATACALVPGPGLLTAGALFAGVPAALGGGLMTQKFVADRAKKEISELRLIAAERTPEGRQLQLTRSKEIFDRAAARGMTLDENLRVGRPLSLKGSRRRAFTR